MGFTLCKLIGLSRLNSYLSQMSLSDVAEIDQVASSTSSGNAPHTLAPRAGQRFQGAMPHGRVGQVGEIRSGRRQIRHGGRTNKGTRIPFYRRRRQFLFFFFSFNRRIPK